MKKRLLFAALAMACVIMLTGCLNPTPGVSRPSDPVPEEGALLLMTGGEQGTYYRFGQVLAEKIFDATGTRLYAVVSGGSQENIESVQNGDAMFGFAQTDVLSYAWEGTRLFDKKMDHITVVAELYKEQVQIVTMDPNIKSVADLKGKSVSIGAAGSGVYCNAIDILAAYGLTERDISPTYQDFGDSISALQSGKIDAAFVVAGTPTSAVSGLAATTNIYLIGLDDEHIDQLIASSPHYSKASISKRTYNTSSDIDTVAVGAVLIANKDAAMEDVYHVISGIYENLDAITKVHSKGAELNLELASEVDTVPYHPGAAAYFAEKGITVPVN